ncbi:MAG TPA: bacillithiol biosynthesis deacetylase BshB1 [Candidatus Sumerlaeota bacterium]|nr:bacillithiol biosynthesis deacetylase BshB1 [Candidatus Sumerlaeota bacterium]HMX61805.1 bacillithiol biosynthesis deacetylase BshB1 [Candidatus Sumerlaeota bacterium]
MSRFSSDALFIGAHPDDGEILAGGLMASLAEKGYRVILADATRGEMGTRGTMEERALEAAEAARILGVERTNLGLPDGGIGRDLEASTRAVVKAIREYRPRLLFTHTGNDHHPDHNAIHTAVSKAYFVSNLGKYDTGQERFAAARLMFFWSHRTNLPPRVDFVADITHTWEKKIAALKAHKTQVAGGIAQGPETFLTGDLFWHRLQARFAYFGSLVSVRYGEPYLSDGILRMDDPLKFSGVLDA